MDTVKSIGTVESKGSVVRMRSVGSRGSIGDVDSACSDVKCS